MESNRLDVLLVHYTSETITEYAVLTEATTVATPSTTSRTTSVKKFGTASTSSSEQKTERFSVEAVLAETSENTLTSTTSSASSIPSSSSWRGSTYSSSLISNTSAAVIATLTTSILNPNSESPASTSLSRPGSSTNSDIITQTTSLTPPPITLPTETLLALPTTSAPKFTHSPLPPPSQEPPSRKPLTITFTTLGSVSLVLLLVTFFIFRGRRKRWDGRPVGRVFHEGCNERKTWSIKKCERSGRRTVYELITSANVHEKDGESISLSTKNLPPLKCSSLQEGSLRESLRSGSSLGGCLKQGMKGSSRRGRERIYELECEERGEVNWVSLKNRVRERTVERLGSSLGIEGMRGVREGGGGKGRAKTVKSVRWAEEACL